MQTSLDADLPGCRPPGCRPPRCRLPIDVDPPGCRPPGCRPLPSPRYINKRAVRILLEMHFCYCCNEVVAKVMFLQVCVCPQGGGCLPQCWDATLPPGPGRPPRTRQTPPWDQADTPREADSGIRSTSSRCASYWNAFLFLVVFKPSAYHEILLGYI